MEFIDHLIIDIWSPTLY